MSKRTDAEKAWARAERLNRLRAAGAKILGYDPATFAALPRWQRDALTQGRLAVDKPRQAAARLAHSMPDAETPTPEASMHDAFAKMPMGENKTPVAYNLTVTPLRRANRDGAISKRQMDAGETFERKHLTAYHSGGTRDPLDLSPRGGQGYISDSHAAAIASARSDLAAIEARVGHATYNRLIDICVLHQPVGDRRAKYLGWVRLVMGLDELAKFFGLPEDNS